MVIIDLDDPVVWFALGGIVVAPIGLLVQGVYLQFLYAWTARYEHDKFVVMMGVMGIILEMPLITVGLNGLVIGTWQVANIWQQPDRFTIFWALSTILTVFVSSLMVMRSPLIRPHLPGWLEWFVRSE